MTIKSTTQVSVRRSVTVALDPERAFELFTSRMDAYWPREHHIGAVPMVQAVLEPHTGGSWYERGVDGSECQWGRVAVWEPPTRLVLIWQLGADWQFDPTLETEVEVTFVPQLPGHTRVELEHRNLERYGERAETMRALFESPGAWDGILARFADLAA
ncbi:MAG: SRPBCC family protein [Pseudonocardiales bacterium]|nr:SRPBCC family protein [Pseudonocardiales bacterium]